MELIQFGRWRVNSDPEATRRAYGALSADGLESCDDAPCQNFAIARNQGKVYPDKVLTLFRLLGINPYHEVEVSHYGRLDTGLHLYGGWFSLIGNIAVGRDALKPVTRDAWHLDLEPVDAHFSLGFTNHTALVPETFAGYPVIQLEFEVKLPWLLDVPEPT